MMYIEYMVYCYFFKLYRKKLYMMFKVIIILDIEIIWVIKFICM